MSGTTQSFIKNQQLHVSAFNKAVVRLYKIYKCNLHQSKFRGLVESRAIWIFFSVTMCAKLELQRSVYLLLSKPMIRISFMLQYSIHIIAFMRSLHSSFISKGIILFLDLYKILIQDNMYPAQLYRERDLKQLANMKCWYCNCNYCTCT